MLFLLLDAAVLIALINILNDGEAPSFLMALAISVAIGLGFWGCGLLLGPTIGIFSLVPMALVAGVVLWLTCGLPIKRAMVAGTILLVYKGVLDFAFSRCCSRNVRKSKRDSVTWRDRRGRAGLRRGVGVGSECKTYPAAIRSQSRGWFLSIRGRSTAMTSGYFCAAPVLKTTTRS